LYLNKPSSMATNFYVAIKPRIISFNCCEMARHVSLNIFSNKETRTKRSSVLNEISRP